MLLIVNVDGRGIRPELVGVGVFGGGRAESLSEDVNLDEEVVALDSNNSIEHTTVENFPQYTHQDSQQMTQNYEARVLEDWTTVSIYQQNG
jgi:hypothetical protein